MKLMFIEEFQIAFGDLENLAAQPADDRIRREDVIAPDAIFVCRKLNSYHGLPPPKNRQDPGIRQADAIGKPAECPPG